MQKINHWKHLKGVANRNPVMSGALGLIIILWMVVLITVPIVEDHLSAGSYGDSFGIVNALFSGLASAGVIITILLQKEELSLQRQELKLTRDELTETRKEFVQQNQTLKQQRFENTFFNLLNARHEALSKIWVSTPGKTAINSHQIMEDYLNEINNKLHFETSSELNYNERLQEYREIYTEKIHGPYRNFIDILLETLNSLLVFVERNELIDKGSKDLYFDIIGSQMSPNEKSILYAHCIFCTDTKKKIVQRISDFGSSGRIPTEEFSSTHKFIWEERIRSMPDSKFPFAKQ
ncbi:MAG TPA: hypothetical protein VD884_08870 [Ohtaekwangia sp.]|nr:hypothetical protein [Ohtaekwangia sp.]